MKWLLDPVLMIQCAGKEEKWLEAESKGLWAIVEMGEFCSMNLSVEFA